MVDKVKCASLMKQLGSGLLLNGVVLSVFAAGTDPVPLQAHVSASTTCDDNLFRLEDGNTSNPNNLNWRNDFDIIYRLEAGVDADLHSAVSGCC